MKNFLIVLCFSFIMLSIETDSVMETSSSKMTLNSHDTGQDDTYSHRGNVSIQFTDKGLVVECYSDNPEFVNEDGTVTKLPAGNWSLWEGELEFTWGTRNTGLCDTKFQAP